MFRLDPRLENDCCLLGDLPLSRLLLLNDSSYPWFILVPRRNGIEEIHQLVDCDQQQLWRESAWLARWMSKTFIFDKLNLGALGNVVRQLHLHHVGRRVGDRAWPGPVWGQHPPQLYSEQEISEIKQQARAGLAADLGVEI
jgi:diadenosine tetraphosphate (Ap4A) HIT family hydrolase